MKKLIARFFVFLFLFLVLIAQGVFVQKRIYLAPNDRIDEMWSADEAKYEARADYGDFPVTATISGSNGLMANGLGGTGDKLAAENAGRPA